MLTREHMLRLHLEVGAAAGLASSKVMVMSRAEEKEYSSSLDGERAEERLALLRAEYAQMITAARASVTAERAGSADPLTYIEAELARHGGLPPRDATVPVVLGDATTAMILAGRAARPHDTARAA